MSRQCSTVCLYVAGGDGLATPRAARNSPFYDALGHLLLAPGVPDNGARQNEAVSRTRPPTVRVPLARSDHSEPADDRQGSLSEARGDDSDAAPMTSARTRRDCKEESTGAALWDTFGRIQEGDCLGLQLPIRSWKVQFSSTWRGTTTGTPPERTPHQRKGAGNRKQCDSCSRSVGLSGQPGVAPRHPRNLGLEADSRRTT